ncbi:MAG TPA: sulfatase, partial [Planctomycetota bacterium]|nr:sulfatase [Planctomycetota bacterium]
MRTLALLLALASPSQADPPNVVVILVDDLGWTDLGCFGSPFYETPHIDRLAAQGMRFTHAYSACTVCSPTRASLMTGKYPARLHVTDWIAGHARPKAKLKVPDWTKHLALEETTVAEALKAAGYATASIGKWHLGPPAHFPEKQGFDLNRGGCDKGQPPSYFSPYRIPTLEEGEKGEYLTDRLTTEALAFLDSNKDRPFLLHFPHYGVHTPLQAKKAVVEKYQAKAKAGADHRNAAYAAMIESVDDSVGRIVAKIEELKLSSRTLIVFTSDNGGLLQSTSNRPLRAGKGSAYEGGVRVPMIVR